MVNTMFAEAAQEAAEAATPLAAGSRVDVRSRFVGAWTHGFEVAERVEDGYRIRRLSDGSVLSEILGFDEVRPERRKSDWWWG